MRLLASKRRSTLRCSLRRNTRPSDPFMPNCIGPIFVNATLAIAAAIVAESTLSFLGFGVQPPDTSWGNMLANAEGNYSIHTHLLYFPGFMILLTVLCVNFLGDGLRDAFDPQSRH